jgi:hypothetical protein
MINKIKISNKNISGSKKKHKLRNKHIKNRYLKKTRKNKNVTKNIQNGGNLNTITNGSSNISNISSKEKFEVKSLEDMDYSALNISKYANKNIDWGIMPGPPPMDCVIL